MKKSSLVIIILSLIILGLVSYLIYDKVVNNDEMNQSNVNEEKEVETNKNLKLDSKEVTSLVALIGEYNLGGLRSAIPYNEDKEVILRDEINDYVKGAIAFGASKLDEKYYDETDNTVQNGTKITAEGVTLIKNNFSRLFGYDGFQKAGFCPSVKNINGNFYMIAACGVGPYINNSAIYATSATQDGSDILLEGKVVFALWNGPSDNNNFESLILSTNQYNEERQNKINKLEVHTYQNIINADSSDLDNFYKLLNEYAKNNADKLDTYIYRFKKNNDSYYLYSVKKA